MTGPSAAAAGRVQEVAINYKQMFHFTFFIHLGMVYGWESVSYKSVVRSGLGTDIHSTRWREKNMKRQIVLRGGSFEL